MKPSLLLRPTIRAGLNRSHLKKKIHYIAESIYLTDVVMIFHWVTLAGSVILLLFVFTAAVLAQLVECVTTEREVAGLFPGGQTNNQDLKITEK